MDINTRRGAGGEGGGGGGGGDILGIAKSQEQTNVLDPRGRRGNTRVKTSVLFMSEIQHRKLKSTQFRPKHLTRV